MTKTPEDRVKELRENISRSIKEEELFVQHLRQEFISEMEKGLTTVRDNLEYLKRGDYSPLLKNDPEYAVMSLVRLLGQSKTDFEVELQIFCANEPRLMSMRPPLPRSPKLESLLKRSSQSSEIARGLNEFLRSKFKGLPLERSFYDDLLSNETLLTALGNLNIVGKSTNKRGQFAEMKLARLLSKSRIFFEPAGKVESPTRRGWPRDIEVSVLPSGRRVNFAIPDSQDPRIIIQCAFYLGKCGGFERRYFEEVSASSQMIKQFNRGHPREAKVFLLFIDGRGFLHPSWDNLLLSLLTELEDNYFTLKAMNTKLLPLLKKYGLG